MDKRKLSKIPQETASDEMLKENAGIDNAFLIKGKELILRVPRDAQEIKNEEDRLQMVSMLAKAGYAVQVVRKEVPAGETRKTTQYEYVIEYGERVE